MPRLPQPGGDKGTWGEVLNEYLSAAHNADGSLKDVPQGKITGLEDALAAKADTSAIEVITAPRWTPFTSYSVGYQVIAPDNNVVTATTNHTSDVAYDFGFWTYSSVFGRTKSVNGVTPDGTGDIVIATGDPSAVRQVVHNADSSIVRPSGTAPVFWVGSVQPINMLSGDIWGVSTPLPVVPTLIWHTLFDAGAQSLADLAAVSTFSDTSGNGHDAVQATVARQPVFHAAASNMPAYVNFFGVDLDSLQTTPFDTPLTQPFTVCMLIRSTSVNTSTTNTLIRRVFDGQSATNEVVFENTGDGTNAFYSTYAGILRNTTSSPVANQWEVISLVMNDANSYVRRNGVQYSYSASPGTNALGGITLGSKFDQASLGFRGDIAYFGIIAGISPSINSIEAALAARAGITLS